MGRTPEEEAAFMSQLMQGIDDDFWTAGPSPDPSPVKKKVFAATDHDIAAFLQDSEHWDLGDDVPSPVRPAAKKAAFESPVKKVKLSKKPAVVTMTPRYVPDRCTRCVVDSVTDSYVDNRWRKTVVARVVPGDYRAEVNLLDDWYHTDIRIDDIFNVLGTFSGPPSSATRTISITSHSNFLVLHPDILITATALSNAPQCRRKPLLSSLVRSTTDITPALVWGNMLHEVMQKCLMERRWEDEFIESCIDEAVMGSLGELVKLGLSEGIAKREVGDRAKGLRFFADKYLAAEPKSTAVLTNTRSAAFESPSLLAITDILDIEEDIWSPTYGLKGKIDATVQGIISDPSSSTPRGRTLTQTPFPLELKTGRVQAGMDHRAQTMLYTLLLSERYGSDVQDGLLFYSQSEAGEIVRVPRGRNEVRGLIGIRNELAAYMWRRIRKKGKKVVKQEEKEEDVEMDIEDTQIKVASQSTTDEDSQEEEHFLPAPIDDERACKRCYALDACLLFRKSHPNHSTAPSSKSKAKHQGTFDPPIPPFLAPIFEQKTGHLTPTHTKFFAEWERLLALEERDLVRFKRELWTIGAEEREKRGRCFSGMVLVRGGASSAKASGTANKEDEQEKAAWGAEGKIHRFTYAFQKLRASSSVANSGQEAASGNFLNVHLSVGEAITISVEPRLLALARGWILELDQDKVVVGVDHVVDIEGIKARLEREGALPSSSSSPLLPTQLQSQRLSESGDVIFRIDKDELFGGMARVRNNLAQLFYVDGDTKRLELVVDLRKPVFRTGDAAMCVSRTSLSTSSSKSKSTSSENNLQLNASQLDAMDKVLSAEDYALVLGMPGTGKTTVIAALIRELVARGKTVLLSSYTHSAVDTILRKVAGADGRTLDAQGGMFNVLRLGNVDKIHPEVRKYSPAARRTATIVEQLEKQLMDAPVVATTCLSIDHPLFSRRKFDYCIVDEASQITLPTCLGPLKFADTFVLVGDHFQLPPLVKNPEARKGGLDVSLFRRLSEAHPEAVVDLRFQYRMNKDIMLLSNRLIYDDRLRCGSEEVAKRTLVLGDKKFLGRLHAHTKNVDAMALENTSRRERCPGGDVCWLVKLCDERCKAVFVDTDNLPAHESRVGDLVQNTTEAELVRQFTETLIRCGVKESQIGIISLYRQQVKVLQNLLQERKGVEILTADKSQGRDKDCVIVSLVRSNQEGNIGDLVKDWRRINVSFTRARSKLVIFGSRKTLEREPLLRQFFELMQKQKWIARLPSGAATAHARVFGICTKMLTKRSADDGGMGDADDEDDALEAMRLRKSRKENLMTILGDNKGKVKGGEEEKEGHPTKKPKLDGVLRGSAVGLLKGRPILKDLVGNEL